MSIGSRVILIAEDNPDDEALTLRALRRANVGNDIVVVRDGVEALDYLSHADLLPQVVLLDLKLPKIDGVEVLRRIRDDARTRPGAGRAPRREARGARDAVGGAGPRAEQPHRHHLVADRADAARGGVHRTARGSPRRPRRPPPAGAEGRTHHAGAAVLRAHAGRRACAGRPQPRRARDLAAGGETDHEDRREGDHRARPGPARDHGRCRRAPAGGTEPRHERPGCGTSRGRDHARDERRAGRPPRRANRR
jgi:hypothetical protein